MHLHVTRCAQWRTSQLSCNVHHWPNISFAKYCAGLSCMSSTQASYQHEQYGWHKLTRSSRVANSVEFPQSLLKFHGHRQLLLPCLCARSSAAVEPEPDGSAGVSHNVSEVDSRRPPATCRTQRLSDSCAILETSMLGER